MRRYPALHAARSEYRGRRVTALGLPVLAVLSWMAAGLLHQPSGPVPLVRHVTNIEEYRSPTPPEEIAQSALRPPADPVPSPRGTSDPRSRALAAGPRLTPAATSRPVSPARPSPAPAPSGGRPGPAETQRLEEVRQPEGTRRPKAVALTETGGPAGTPRPSATDATRLTETVATATAPTAGPPASPSAVRPQNTGEPSPARDRSEPATARAASAEPASPAPSPSERRTPFAAEPVPREARECGGLLLPLFGCPAWASILWGP